MPGVVPAPRSALPLLAGDPRVILMGITTTSDGRWGPVARDQN